MHSLLSMIFVNSNADFAYLTSDEIYGMEVRFDSIRFEYANVTTF